MTEFGNGNGNGKRGRDEPPKFSEAKRFKEVDLIFDILDEDDVDPDGNLADVIKSLEEEIAAAPVAEEVDGPPPQLDLGYLLEASDDELGLPPANGSSSSSTSTDGGDVVEIVDEEHETAGFDRIWGFEDDMTAASPYGCLEFGITAEFHDGVIFDGGLFDYGQFGYGPSDAEEFSWRTES